MIAALLLPLMPFLALLGGVGLVALAVAITFWPRVLPALIAFLEGLRAAQEVRRRRRSFRKATRCPR